MSEFVLRGGRVIDPANGVDGSFDVVVRDGRVSELLAPRARSATRTEDVTGAIVTPGFVDLHGHWYEGSPWGIDPLINLRSGVTTPCDAGTTGYENFPEFRRYTLDESPVRVLVFLHIGSLGCASMLAGELEDFRYVRVPATIQMIETNRDVIVGVKARLGTQPCGPNIMAALEAALKAVTATNVPLILHVSSGADLRRILPRLRPGDIVTHTFIADDGGLLFGGGETVLPEVWDAKRRGVLFDVGHGCGSFDWDVYKRATAQGFRLDSISTDLHRLCVEGPVFDMLTTMSKFLHAGMPIPDVVAASTIAPARAIRRDAEIGSLGPGRRADIAVFRTEAGSFDYVDAFGHSERASQRFVPVLTVNGGEIVRPEDVSIRLRPYTDADREVDCGAPLMTVSG
ncbi:MAG TPA: amidohydrolase/deacetylase family metallohydrolase [Candidatus Saccharimonadales bacterium]|nr:amidohydrolase/deacetylase family metallohydrolase [Candidatus Saccharimonadales bacterium]